MKIKTKDNKIFDATNITDLITQMRLDSRSEQDETNLTFMTAVARRCQIMKHDALIRTDTPENWFNDLVEHGFLSEVE